METRARHLLIGGFVLAFAAGIVLFFIWLSRVELAEDVARYHIFFGESVSGIGIGSDVRFNGIKVGRVSEIAIDPVDPSQVRVTADITGEVPIRADAYAILQLQGITGLSFVQIMGRTSDAPMLPRMTSGELPVVPSRPSKIAELVQGAPELLTRTGAVIERAGEILGPENQRRVAAILTDIHRVTSAIAAREGQIGHIIEGLDQTQSELAAAAKGIRQMAEKADSTFATLDKLTKDDVAAFLADSRKTAASLAKLADDLEGTFASSREGIEDFAGVGLSEFREFIGEARVLVANLSRIAARIESAPSGVLFGQPGPDFEPTPAAPGKAAAQTP
jgi:phospholipid/cholesterol/gamma-HCH transport system substrate-binding protein